MKSFNSKNSILCKDVLLATKLIANSNKHNIYSNMPSLKNNYFLKNFHFFTKNSTNKKATLSSLKQQYSYINKLLIKHNNSKFVSTSSQKSNTNTKEKEINIKDMKENIQIFNENLEDFETKITESAEQRTKGFCSNMHFQKDTKNEDGYKNVDNCTAVTMKNTNIFINNLLEITKFKLSALNCIVSLSTYIYFIVDINLFHLVSFTLGTMCISMTTQVLNQIIERIFDCNMKRTQNRPMPKSKFTPMEALVIASSLYFSSLVFYSTLPYGISTALISNLILFLYIQVYTPLKRINNMSMHVGAVVGALPALLGSVAAVNGFPGEALLLAGYILTWQYPHFYGILYPNRADYKNAGFKFISVNERKDKSASYQIAIAMILMLIVVNEMHKEKVIGNIGFGLFMISFFYQLPAVYKFPTNAVKYGKILRIRSYTPFLIILGAYFNKAICYNFNKYFNSNSKDKQLI